MTVHQPAPDRYDSMPYRRCGKSGLRLSSLSLGLWHNFGDVNDFDNGRAMIRHALDLGITHFDLANNYGPPPGSAEVNFGRVLKMDLAAHRDELIISSKAGFRMWPGPYGEWGSRKNLLASLDQSLKRMGLAYVDIFYHHRPDPDTPLEESMGALAHAVQSGRALYVGISNYRPDRAREAIRILREMGTPCLIHQPRYNMFDRWIEDGLLDVLGAEGVGCIPFCPLAQGMLTGKYLDGIPEDSRAASEHGFLNADRITPGRVATLRQLDNLARARGQNLAQLALSWVLRDGRISSALIGASRTSQISDCVAALESPPLREDELQQIDGILAAAKD